MEIIAVTCTVVAFYYINLTFFYFRLYFCLTNKTETKKKTKKKTYIDAGRNKGMA